MDVLRAGTDERVLRALMRHRRLTRAGLATEIGISKPTATESVRRLAGRGLVEDTGERTPGGRGRGRVGTYYAISPGVGTALAVSIAPGGVVAERIDAYGETVARVQRSLGRPARPDRVAAAVREAAADLRATAGHPARLAVVSAADPVDRATGRLVQLPDAPFLVGELDPVTILASEADGPVTVDNDVNWAARAERDHDPAGPADFAYLFLDEGLGCAVVSDGEVMRGRNGLAGEIAHLLTAGPDGTATRLIEVFARLGLRRPASTAIDVDRLLAEAAASPGLRGALGRAVGGAVAALVAFADPEVVVVGGSWGPALLDAIGAAVTELPRPVPVRAAAVTAEPALTGARAEALRRLRTAIVAAG